MKSIKYLFSFVIIGVILCSCGGGNKRKLPKNSTITIISTNDIHGDIDNFAKLASFVKAKEAEGGEVILVDAGDHFTGNPYVDYADERGKPIIELMNEVDYDVACMGNHEFDYGQSVLKERLDDADYPYICANINIGASGLSDIKPYHIEEVNGLKLAFLGLIQLSGPDNIPSSSPIELKGLSFTNFRERAPEYKHLVDSCDIFIALSHLGIEDDSVLTTVLPELDIIIGGHTHTLIDKEMIYNDILITQTGEHMNNLGVITLRFEYDKLVERKYELVSLNDFKAENTEVKEMIKEIYSQDKFNEVVGTAKDKINGRSYVASLITDAMRAANDSDFAFYNRGGVRDTVIEKGGITLDKVLRIDPFGNEVMIFDMTAKEIKDFIISGYNKYNSINYYISEGRYEIVVEKDRRYVNLYDRKGKLVKDDSKKYSVAITDYVASIEPALKNGRFTGEVVSGVVKKYLKKNSPIFYDKNRIKIIKK